MATIYDDYYRQQYEQGRTPDPSDYANPADYQTALNDYVKGVNGEQMLPKSYDFEAPGSGTLHFKGAGDTNQITTGEYWANHWNGQLGKPHGMMDVALANWVKNNPDAAMAMYLAVGPDGKPLLDSSIAGLMEAQGFRPPADTSGAPGTTDPFGSRGSLGPGTSAGGSGNTNVAGAHPASGNSRETTGGNFARAGAPPHPSRQEAQDAARADRDRRRAAMSGSMPQPQPQPSIYQSMLDATAPSQPVPHVPSYLQPNTSTIDPRYPDWLINATQYGQ